VLVVVVDLVEELAHFDDLLVRLEHAPDLLAESLRGPTQVGFEDLADVHTRGHAERVQHDVHGTAVRHERHVLDGTDHRHHALVAVPAGHLVARLDAALDGEVDLYHFQHARREVVAGRDLGLLVLEALLELGLVLGDLLLRALEHVGGVFVFHADREPLVLLQRIEVFVGDRRALLERVWPAVRHLADDLRAQAVVDRAFQDAELIVEVLLDALDLHLLDLQRTLVLLDAVAREHGDVDDGAVHARRHAQRAVLHVRRLLAEDRAQELLFRRQLALALRRDLADEDVARLDLGTDVDHARLVEPRERLLADVRDVGRDFLRTELGVARLDREFLDVDRRVAVFLDDAFGDQDRVLEVVAVPGHERDEHVLAERELAQVGRGPVGEHVAPGDHVADVDERLLVHARVMVRARVIGQRVDVDARVVVADLVLVDAHDDAAGVDLVDHASAARDRGHA